MRDCHHCQRPVHGDTDAHPCCERWAQMRPGERCLSCMAAAGAPRPRGPRDEREFVDDEDEQRRQRARRAIAKETIAAQIARFDDMGWPDDGGAYMLDNRASDGAA